MAKTKISEYSATAANNTDVESVNIAEGCAPSGINNAIREVMSHLKDFQVGSAGDDLTVGGNFSVTGTVTIPDNAISGDKVEGGTINAITINTLSANPTLSAGTANGVTYLNGSKVLTSGSALTFAGTSLGINGASANILFDNGGVSGSSLQLGTSGSSHGYIGTVGSFPLLFQVNGVEAMRIGLATGGLRTVGIGYTSLTSVGDNGLAVFGNVGIGTNSPAEKLEVVGGIRLSSYLHVSSGSTGKYFGLGSSITGAYATTDLAIWNVSAGNTIFYQNGGERARIDSSGRLLVNTTAGYGKFTVASTAGTGKVLLDNYATVPTTENVMSIYADASRGYIQSYNNGYKDIAICSGGGNVGIGTTSISGKLSINGEVYAAAGSASGVAYGFYPKGTYGNTGMFSPAPNTVAFATTGGERVRIDSSGHLIVPNGITLGTAVGTYADANTLDDYEEGTWTPTISGNGTNFSGTTYGATAGLYTKVGRTVWVSFDITVSNAGTLNANGATINGIPFSIPNNADLRNGGGGIGYTTAIQSNYVYQSCYPQNNSSYLYIIGRTAASNATTPPAANAFYANSIRITGYAWWNV